jgi:hypothetical protein
VGQVSQRCWHQGRLISFSQYNQGEEDEL